MKIVLFEMPSLGGQQRFQLYNQDSDVRTEVAVVPDPYVWPVKDAGDSNLMEQLQWYLERFLNYPFEPNIRRAENVEASLRKWGAKVFEILFEDKTASSWLPDEVGVLFDFTISCDSPRLLSWPWEALCNPATGYFAHHVRIQRRLSKDVPNIEALPASIPRDQVNILLITARPFEKDVQYRSVSRPLIDLVKTGRLSARVDILRPPTFDNLLKVLRERRGMYHVLHFDGHGGYGIASPNANVEGEVCNRRGAEGQLIFENSSGGPDGVSAEKISSLLAECGIPFVVMNACRSGALDENAHENTAFASVAGALVKAGFRGVLAMSYNLTVVGALNFFPAFYRELFESGDLVEATRLGRCSMIKNPGRSSWNPAVGLKDWLLPVVYQQRDDFDLSFTGPVEPAYSDLKDSNVNHCIKPNRFVGRDFVIQMLERRLGLRSGAVLVYGLGGVGKSTLVSHFLDWLNDTGGLVNRPFWFNFDDIRSASHVFNEMGRRLFGSGFDSESSGRIAALTSRLRDEIEVLIVWDNFESARGFESDGENGLLSLEDRNRLKNFLKALYGGKTKVVITSRSREAWLPEDHCYRLKLGGLFGLELWEYAADVANELNLVIDRSNGGVWTLLEDKLMGHPALIKAVLSQVRDGDINSILDKIDAGLGEVVEAASEGALEVRSLVGSLIVLESHMTDLERSLLLPISLHERYLDLGVLERIGNSSELAESYNKTAMCGVANSLEAAGMLTLFYNKIYIIHPLLTTFLKYRFSVPGVHNDTLAKSWEKAFFVVMKELACAAVGEEPQKQSSIMSIHRANFYRSLDLAKGLGVEQDSSYCLILQALGSAALRLREFLEARRCFHELADRWSVLGIDKGVSASYHHLGLIAEDHRDFVKAEKYFEKAKGISELQRDNHALGPIYHHLGIVAQKRDDLSVAERWFNKSMEANKKIGNDSGIASTLHQLGGVALVRRRYVLARKLYMESLKIKERLGNDQELASVFHQLGMLAQFNNEFLLAKKWYYKSIEISERQRKYYKLASTYNQLGSLANRCEDLTGAENLFLKSLEASERHADDYGVASSCYNLGQLALRREDFTAAAEWCRRSLALSKKNEDKNGLALGWFLEGRISQYSNDLNRAEELYHEALVFFKENNNSMSARVFCQMSEMHIGRKCFDEAGVYALEALKCHDEFSEVRDVNVAANLLAKCIAYASEEISLKLKVIGLNLFGEDFMSEVKGLVAGFTTNRKYGLEP